MYGSPKMKGRRYSKRYDFKCFLRTEPKTSPRGTFGRRFDDSKGDLGALGEPKALRFGTVFLQKWGPEKKLEKSLIFRCGCNGPAAGGRHPAFPFGKGFVRTFPRGGPPRQRAG